MIVFLSDNPLIVTEKQSTYLPLNQSPPLRRKKAAEKFSEETARKITMQREEKLLEAAK